MKREDRTKIQFASENQLYQLEKLKCLETELKLKEKELEKYKEQVKSLYEYNNIPVLLIAPKAGDIVDANPAACFFYGYKREEIKTKKITDINMLTREQVSKIMEQVKSLKHQHFYFHHRLANGEIRDVEVYIGRIKVYGKNVIYSIIHDITEWRKAEMAIKRLSYHDIFTGLPNRTLFNNCLSRELGKHKGDNKVAIMFLDLDRFTYINDTLGYEIGDRLLKAAVERIKLQLRHTDILARIRGDQLTVLLPGITQKKDVEMIALKIMDALYKPLKVEDYELYITCSIGISIYPYDGKDAKTLIKAANIAMYRAKDLGGNGYKFFTSDMSVSALECFNMLNSLKYALEREELDIYYQPKVDVKTGKIIGTEALLRWNHPDLGIVAPDRFIPLAEETLLIVPIGEWVLRTACIQTKAWQDEGYPPLQVSVNLSVVQLQQYDFVQSVVSILDETGLEPHYLELEITESAVINNMDLIKTKLSKLAKMGVHITMDDFGTGYSSLTYLNEMPINALKIDKSFIHCLTLDSNSMTITSAIIEMAHRLGLRVTAEGVETQSQLAFLREHQCDYFQGYLFSPPVPHIEFERILV